MIAAGKKEASFYFSLLYNKCNASILNIMYSASKTTNVLKRKEIIKKEQKK